MTLKLGTRGSALAVAQSSMVARQVEQVSGHKVELVIIRTRGDAIVDRPLSQVGGKGLFTAELEAALHDGSIDFAVHSLKDLPTEDPEGLVIGAIPKREDPRDVLVGARLNDLAEGAVVGTGSARRAMQLKMIRPDLDIKGIRGNVDTRIQKQRDGEYDVVVLAAAGISRLGRSGEITQALEIDQVIPAAGQGALAVQARGDRKEILSILKGIHDPQTAACVAVERSFLAKMQGGCSVPAGAHAYFDGELLKASAFFATPEGRIAIAKAEDIPEAPYRLGLHLAELIQAELSA